MNNYEDSEQYEKWYDILWSEKGRTYRHVFYDCYTIEIQAYGKHW